MNVRYKRIMVLTCLCVLLSLSSATVAAATETESSEAWSVTEETQMPDIEVPDHTEVPEAGSTETEETEDAGEQEQQEPESSEEQETFPIEEPEPIAVTDIVLSDCDDVLEVDSTLNLTATVFPSNATDQTIYYSSSDPKIATVSQTGEVKGVSSGNVTISISCGGVVRKIALTVKVSAKLIQIDKACVMLKLGDTYQIQAHVAPENATDKTLSYSSDNADIATVSKQGLITAHAYGNATIIIKNEDAFAAVSVIVNGNPPPEESTQQTAPHDEVYTLEDSLQVSDCPVVNKQMLQYLYENEADLHVTAADYSIIIRGKYINNFNNELKTDISLSRSYNGFTFHINDNKNLCGAVFVCIKEAQGYKYLYLYNNSTKKYVLVDAENFNEIKITTPGKYMLTNSPPYVMNIPLLWIILPVSIIAVLIAAYVLISKKHWFW